MATKFLPRSTREIEDGVTGQQHIEQMLDLSLSHLGMDYVDLYIYHMWDYQTPIYDILDGMNRMVKAGKVRQIALPIATLGSWPRPMRWPKRKGLPPSFLYRITTT